MNDVRTLQGAAPRLLFPHALDALIVVASELESGLRQACSAWASYISTEIDMNINSLYDYQAQVGVWVCGCKCVSVCMCV